MANFFELTSTATLADGDLLAVVDISDTAQSANGSTRKTQLSTVRTFVLTELASTANAKGASLVGVEDSGGLYTATDVEAALAEVKAIADAAGTGSGDALVADGLDQFAATTSAELAGVISDETGTGALVFANSPTLVTPALGTPSGGTLTNATGLPIASGVAGLGTGIATALAVNTGSAGAPVIFNGALGTPSSGDLSNCTGAPAASMVRAIGAVFDGGGSAITVDTTVYVHVPYSGTISKVTVIADQTGSIVIDVWKDTYANYPPTVADTITASALPTISSAIKYQDGTLTGWTTSVSVGDILAFNVDSVTTITWASIQIEITT